MLYIFHQVWFGNFDKDSVNEDDFVQLVGIYGSLKLSGEII